MIPKSIASLRCGDDRTKLDALVGLRVKDLYRTGSGTITKWDFRDIPGDSLPFFAVIQWDHVDGLELRKIATAIDIVIVEEPS